MQFRTIIKILGQLVALFSITMVPPALVSLIYKDGGGVPFVLAFIFSVVIGMMAYYPNRHENGDLKAREGFLIVVCVSKRTFEIWNIVRLYKYESIFFNFKK